MSLKILFYVFILTYIQQTVTVRGTGETEMNKRGCPQGAGGAQERTLVAQQGRNQRLKEA